MRLIRYGGNGIGINVAKSYGVGVIFCLTFLDDQRILARFTSTGPDGTRIT